jgi:hypothetical protein
MPKSPFAVVERISSQLKKEFGHLTPRALLAGSRTSSPCCVVSRPASLDQSQTFRLSTTPEGSVPRFTVDGIFSDSEAASSRPSSSPQQFVLSPTKSESQCAPSDTQWMDCDIPPPSACKWFSRRAVAWAIAAMCAALSIGHSIRATTPYQVYF